MKRQALVMHAGPGRHVRDVGTGYGYGWGLFREEGCGQAGCEPSIYPGRRGTYTCTSVKIRHRPRTSPMGPIIRILCAARVNPAIRGRTRYGGTPGGNLGGQKLRQSAAYYATSVVGGKTVATGAH